MDEIDIPIPKECPFLNRRLSAQALVLSMTGRTAQRARCSAFTAENHRHSNRDTRTRSIPAAGPVGPGKVLNLRAPR